MLCTHHYVLTKQFEFQTALSVHKYNAEETKEVQDMTYNSKKNPTANTRHMDVDGYSVTLIFSVEPNHKLSNIIRSALIDSFLQPNCSVDEDGEFTA